MKKLISTLTFVFAVGLISISAQCCNSSKTKTTSETTVACKQSKQASNVKAYYFHATRRCATCQAVESVTEEALKEYYGTKVSFQAINREEDKENPMLAQYKVSGQTLLIIKGDKVVNLTNEAFMNARTNPDKFKAKLKSTVDSMM
ncbi:MAG: thioredoxin family protein [Salinivirgaceae bacterium]|nr:thioredoxin family protein [Salinivirgaceae bacterium]